MVSDMQEDKIKVGLALGSGGGRGLAHIGVLKVLKREGIPIDYIVGSSIGAVVGAFYATGIDLELLEKLVYNLDIRTLIDPVISPRDFVTKEKMKEIMRVFFSRKGIIYGEKIYQFIRLLTKEKTFAQANIPLAVIASDIERGEAVVFQEGEIAQAVRASISIPGIFEPVILGGRTLVDGGVTSRVPVRETRDLGLDVIIGVDVGSDFHFNEVNNACDIIMQSIEILDHHALQAYVPDADIFIRPQVGEFSTAKFERREECIACGMLAAEAVLPDIWRVIKEKEGK